MDLNITINKEDKEIDDLDINDIIQKLAGKKI